MPINSFSKDSFQLQLEETLGALLLTPERFFQNVALLTPAGVLQSFLPLPTQSWCQTPQFKGVVPSKTDSHTWGPQRHHTLTNWLQSQGLPGPSSGSITHQNDYQVAVLLQRRKIRNSQLERHGGQGEFGSGGGISYLFTCYLPPFRAKHFLRAWHFYDLISFLLLPFEVSDVMSK